MLMHRAARLALPLIVALICSAAPMGAQQNMSVAEALADFPNRARLEPPHDRSGGVMTLWRVIASRSNPAQLDSALAGLETIALSADDPSARLLAARMLHLTGVGSRPLPGTVARVVRVYQKSKDREVKHTLLSLMVWTAERGPAVAFLKDVATQPDATADYPGAARDAIQTLQHAGPQGRAALQDLSGRRLIRSPDAERYLQHLERMDLGSHPHAGSRHP